MSQNKALLNYLKQGNTITSREAYNKLGITQLGRCLDDIDKEGYEIDDRWIKVPTRHGKGKTRVKEYWLKGCEQQANMFSTPKRSRVYDR